MSDIYVYLGQRGTKAKRTQMMQEQVNFDYDAEGNLIGVEVLDYKGADVDGDEI